VTVILTTVRIQSHKGRRSWLWILTFVRMTAMMERYGVRSE